MTNPEEDDLAFLAAALDGSPTGMAIFDSTGRNHLVNQALQDMLGYSREDMLAPSWSWEQVTPTRFAPLDRQMIGQALHTTKTVTYEKAFLRRDRTEVPVLFSCRRLADVVLGSGKNFMGTAIDISALKEEQDHWQEVFDAATLPISIFDEQGRFHAINRAYAELLGYSRAELLDPTFDWHRLVPRDTWQDYDQTIASARHGDHVTHESALVARDGRRIPVILTYHRLRRRPQWSSDRLVETIVDISDLKAREAYWHDILDHLVAAVGAGLIEDNGARIEYINDAYCLLLGYRRDELLAPGSLARISHPDDLVQEMALIQQAIVTGAPISYHKRYIRKDGAQIHVFQGLQVIKGPDSAPRVFVSLLDETELMRNKAALEQSLADQRAAVAEVNRCLALLAQGELDIHPGAALTGEFAPLVEAMRQLCARLTATIQDIQHLSISLAQRATAQRQGSEALSERSEQQAAAVQHIIEESHILADKAAATSTQAHEVRQATASMREHSLQGREVIATLVARMGVVEEAGSQIGTTITLVDEIAFQTNLLALNAAVEAARAGVAGRGFAVVANEVRRLATDSATGAKDIARFVAGIRTALGEADELANRSADAFGALVTQIQAAATEIIAMAQRAHGAAEAMATLQQSADHIGKLAQANAVLVEQNASGAAELASSAQRLAELAELFHLP